MELSNPPIGLAAVEAFYNPIKPQLVAATAKCGTREFHITAHKKAMPNILTFFNLVNLSGYARLIHSFDGCYVDRPKRLSNQLSMHGRGAAFDINASTNQQGTAGTIDMRLVEIARRLGFFWGGDFYAQYHDPMHFQLGTDFALNGRPQPRVVLKDEATKAPSEFTGVKVFAADGSELYANIGHVVTAEYDTADKRLIVRIG